MIEYRDAVYFLDRKNIELFLQKYELSLEKDVEYTIIAEDDGKIVGTGSVSGSVLKCFAIDNEYRNMAITNTIISKLIDFEFNRGITHLFIFTKPDNSKIFNDFGFNLVAKVDEVALLDNKIERLYTILEDLHNSNEDNSKTGVIVINANPMTLGHLKLIEEASKQVEKLHVFMVSEDESDFPYEFRYEIVKNAIEPLLNVILHRGNEYIISKNTFPTYFYKDTETVIKSYSYLDIKTFAEYFVKALNVKKRFVGTELSDVVTREYNLAMKEILPEYGVEVIEIERFKINGEVISASKVRKLLRDGKLEEAYTYLPGATIEALKSDYGKKLIEGLKWTRILNLDYKKC